jgi:hypothetical protein
LDEATSLSSNHKITNNTLKQSVQQGITGYEMIIKIMSSKNVLVDGNVITGGVSSFLISDARSDHPNVGNADVENITIINNVMDSATAFQTEGCGNITCSSANYTIKNLVIRNNISINSNCMFMYCNMGLIDCYVENNNYSNTTNSDTYKSGQLVRLYTPIIIDTLVVRNNICRGFRVYCVVGNMSNSSLNVLENIVVTGNKITSTDYSQGVNFNYLKHDISKLVIDSNIFTFGSGNSFVLLPNSGATINILESKITNNKFSHNPNVGVIGAFEYYNNDYAYSINNANLVSYQNDNGRKVCKGSSTPVAFNWSVGDICYNTNITEQGTTGSKYIIDKWICTTAGTPGTWLPSKILTGN